MKNNSCVNCSHDSLPPFYQGYYLKRKRYATKNSRCPECKTEMELELDDYTEEERASRQVGMPSLCCGVPYKPQYGWYQIAICKNCDKPFRGNREN